MAEWLTISGFTILQTKIGENITKYVAQDIVPMWIGDEIFFISDRDMTMNIFVYNTQTKQTEKVTNYTDYDVKFPQLERRGHCI
mgnify:CR=1 FL=1